MCKATIKAHSSKLKTKARREKQSRFPIRLALQPAISTFEIIHLLLTYIVKNRKKKFVTTFKSGTHGQEHERKGAGGDREAVTREKTKAERENGKRGTKEIGKLHGPSRIFTSHSRNGSR